MGALGDRIIFVWVLAAEKMMTGTVVHAPYDFCSLFEIPAAWDTGACHHFFYGPITNRPQVTNLPHILQIAVAD